MHQRIAHAAISALRMKNHVHLFHISVHIVALAFVDSITVQRPAKTVSYENCDSYIMSRTAELERSMRCIQQLHGSAVVPAHTIAALLFLQLLISPSVSFNMHQLYAIMLHSYLLHTHHGSDAVLQLQLSIPQGRKAHVVVQAQTQQVINVSAKDALWVHATLAMVPDLPLRVGSATSYQTVQDSRPSH
jgi:hypothetical protein